MIHLYDQYRFIAAWIIIVIFSLRLPAQEMLSLEQCRKMALEKSEEIQIAQRRVDKALTEESAAKTNRLPSIAASASGLYLKKDIEMELWLPTSVPDPTTGALVPNLMTHPVTGDIITGADGNPLFNMYAWLPLDISLHGAFLAGIAVEQPVYAGGRIATAIRMSGLGVDMSRELLAAQQADIIYETDQAYWLYVAVQEKVKLAESFNGLLEALEKRIADAFENGLSTRNELLKVMVKHNEAKLQLQRAKSGLELGRMSLCRLTGLPFNTRILTTDTTFIVDHKASYYEYESGVTGRPEYRVLKQNIEMARLQWKLARSEFLPVAGIRMGLNYTGGIDIGNTSYNSSNAFLVASLKIPIFHWGEGKKRALSASYDLKIRQSELLVNESLMSLETEQAWLSLKDARLRALLAKENLLQAEENLKINRDNYELGMNILTDLLEAQALWQSARSELIEALASLKLQESALRKATGNLN